MFGFSKIEKQKKETERLLHELFGMHPNDARDIVRNHAKVLFPALEPIQAALVCIVVGSRILVDCGHIHEALILKTKLLAVGPALVATKQLAQQHVDKALADMPLLDIGPVQHQSSKQYSPSRVEAVRAGNIFTFYWETFKAKNYNLPEPSLAELTSLETPLRKIFRNPSFPLEQVVSIYQSRKGSNDILKTGMKGHPDYVFQWFRIGQVLSGLTQSATFASDLDFDLAKSAVRGNLSSGGVSEKDCDEIILQASILRQLNISPDNQTNVIAEISRFQDLFINAAAKQDSYAEFERKAQKHGGVFISYSRKDLSIALEISKRLDNDGICFWLDEREILGGEEVRTSLKSAIEKSCVIVVLLSMHSIYSPWVEFEIKVALGGVARGTHVLVPVLLQGVNAENLPKSLHHIVAIDLSSGVEAGFPGLLRSINSHLVKFEERRLRGNKK